MIILFDEKEKEFDSLGIGVLKDASSCVVSEELNGAFELEMEYPVFGAHYKDLILNRLILAKPNEYMQSQPFRIYKITKPIDGTVTVYAEHISYDTSKIPVKAFKAETLEDAINSVQNGTLIKSKFKISTDKEKVNTSFVTSVPYSMRSLLMGESGSILATYSGEFLFDRFNITLKERRGIDRDFTIRYSKNMTDLEQETSSEVIYNGICPYYTSTTTTQKTAMTKKYKEIYMSATAESEELLKLPDGTIGYPIAFFSNSENGKGLSALSVAISTSAKIMATADTASFKLYNHLFKVTSIILNEGTEDEQKIKFLEDVTYNMAFIDKTRIEFGREWLFKDEELTEAYSPSIGEVYRIYTAGDKKYKCYIWKHNAEEDKDMYMPISKEDNVEEYAPSIPAISTESEEKSTVLSYEGGLIYVNEIRAMPRDGATEFSKDWLKEVEEQDQVRATDPRWKDAHEGTPITPREEYIYKVATVETFIKAYPIAKTSEYTENWLSLEKGGTTALKPVDWQGYEVYKEDKDKFVKFRWNPDKAKYEQVTDTRYSYKNYNWDTTANKYVEHDTENDRILTLDLSDKFDETPSSNAKFFKKIYDETISYIKENKIGQIKDNITVSFVKLSTSPEYSKWKELEHIELGDTVHVIYEDLGINVTKKVSKTQFNVLTETYEEIELGDGSSSFTSNAVVTGDNVSSLTNDKNYANKTTVTNLIAENINADFIKAVNAEITEAQIATLTTEEITTTLIEAETLAIDRLVAELMVSDDAAIRNQLMVGENLIVNGEVNIDNGTISITNDGVLEYTKAWINSIDGIVEYGSNWLKANYDDELPLDPTTNIGTIFKVYDKNNVWTQEYYIWDKDAKKYKQYVPDGDVTTFMVDKKGHLVANSAEIKGEIVATSGVIGGANIVDGVLKIGEANFGTISADLIRGGTIKASELLLRNADATIDAYINTDNAATEFGVNWLKNAKGEVIVPKDGSLYELFDTDGSRLFQCYRWSDTKSRYEEYDNYTCVSIDDKGSLQANYVNLAGGTIEDLAITGKIYFGDNYVKAYELSSDESVKYTSKWLTDAYGKTTEIEPDSQKIYILGTDYAPEFYRWDETENKYIKTEGAVIDEDGLYMPGITATSYGTNIAGFTISDNTMISENTILLEDGITKKTKLVGISSAESEDYAFWAGPPDATGENPFYVTHDGEIHAMAGKIGAFYIGQCLDNVKYKDETGKEKTEERLLDVLSTNPDKVKLYSNKDGLFMNSKGLSYINNDYDAFVVIDSYYGIGTTNIGIDPFALYPISDKYSTGASPMLTLIALNRSDEDTSVTPDNTILKVENIIYRQRNPVFILPISNVIINKRSSRKISFSSGNEGWLKPELNLIPEHIQVECVTIGSRRNAGNYSSNNVTYVINDEQTITVYNDASDYQACVDILVVFSGVVESKKNNSEQQN